MKPGKCKHCGAEFQKATSFQSWCSPDCAIQIAKKKTADKKAKEQRKQHKEAKERIKTRRQWLAEAQAAVNAWVRWRDRDLPCISCGRFHDGQWHAGHYLSVGSHPELRFEEGNIYRQCAPCNNHLSGNAIMYRKGLIERRGLAVVEWLEGPHKPLKLTIDEIKAIRDIYRARLKEGKADISH